jgi:hypothetical protein
MNPTKITLYFQDKEMKWIETMLTKYYGSKPKTKKELKRRLEMFVGTMFNKGIEAIEHGDSYVNMEE